MCFVTVATNCKLTFNCIFQVLGSGYEVITVGKRKLVRSVPTELNKDHNEILELAQVLPLYFMFPPDSCS